MNVTFRISTIFKYAITFYLTIKYYALIGRQGVGIIRDASEAWHAAQHQTHRMAAMLDDLLKFIIQHGPMLPATFIRSRQMSPRLSSA